MRKLILSIYKRELKNYFQTPIAYVFIVVFLLLLGILTFYATNFYETGNASLEAFFRWHPWLYLFLMPAISMRLWAEERHSGTFELLLTFPITPFQAVVAKFMAACTVMVMMVLCTFPIWITVNYLGDPDNGVIVAGYLASMMLGASMIAIGQAMSALTKSQVIAFVMSSAACFLLMLSGFPLVINFIMALGLPQLVVDTLSGFSLLLNYSDMSRGVISAHHVIYFISLIGVWLWICVFVVEAKTH